MNLNINLDELKEKKELISVVLLGGAAILVVLTCITVTKFFLLSTKTENVILNAIKQSKRPPQEVEQALANTQALVENLRMNNLFAPPVNQNTNERPQVVPVNPVTEVTAILGNLVCINENWYSIGDTIPGTGGNAKISAIGFDSTIGFNYVTVEFNERTQNLYVINAATRASEISTTNPMASMMGGGISINGGNITISTSAANDILSRLTQGGRGGMMGGMMGGGGGGRGGRGGGGMGGMGGGGRGGRGGGGFGGF